MSQDDILWSFCNSETSFQSEEMPFDKAIEFAKKIPASEREFWFAWQTGWEDWKAVLDVEQFKNHVRDLSKPPPPPPRRHQEPQASPPPVAPAAAVAPAAPAPAPQAPPVSAPPVSVAASPTSASLAGSLNHEAIEAMMPPPAPAAAAKPAEKRSERRRFPRHEVRFRVIIRNETLTFRTFTKDISLGGLSLENPVPEKFFDQKCQIFIGDPDGNENIRFTLQSAHRQDRRYFSFAGVDEKMSVKLGQWIKNQVDKATRKKAG
jgi:hypothetical protein